MTAAKEEKSQRAAEDSQPVYGRITKMERDSVGRLVAHLAGRDEPIEDVRVARCCPWSLPEAYVSVRNRDGKEIALLRTLEELGPASRRIVEEELRDKIFNPRIQRVVEYKHEFGVTSIKVETDRGVVTFQIHSRDDVRVLSPGRALFRDVDGNTYELADLFALDPVSQKYLQDYF